MGSFWGNYLFFELKKYRELIFHDTDERCKIWRRISLSFQNWHKRSLTYFDSEHSRVLKICTLMDSFWASILIALTIGAKCFGKLPFFFKNDKKNLTNFRRMKNSDFILENKLVELNQNKNSKQADRPDAVWKLYFTLEISE